MTTGQTLGLEEIILHHSFKKMSGKTVRVPCRDRTHLSGDNGAGKTSILALIPVFYGEEPERLVSKAGSKESFLEFYLKTPQSMIIFEYTQVDGFCCVVLYRHRSNKICYRFIKGAADDTIFSESISEKLREGASAQEAIDLLKDSNVRVSRQILTIQDYRAIIQRDPELIRRKGADTRSLRAEAMEFGLGGPDTKMRFIHKLAHVVLNKNNLMGNFKTMICETMFQDIHLNSAPVSLDAESLIAEIYSLKAFAEETGRIRDCLVKNNQRLKLMDEALQVKQDLSVTLEVERDRLQSMVSNLKDLREEIERLESEFNEQRRERLGHIEAAKTHKESIERQLDKLHEKHGEYQDQNLAEKVEAMKTLPDIKNKLTDLRSHLEMVTQKVDQYKTAYDQEVARLETAYTKWVNNIEKQQTQKEKERDAADSRMNNELATLGSKKAEEILAYFNERQEGHQKLISRRDVLESQIENAGLLEKEQQLLSEAKQSADDAFDASRNADRKVETLEKEEEAAKHRLDKAIEEEGDAKIRLESRIAERDELLARLNPEPGSWRHELREKDPDWGVTLGRVINPDLLDRKDLNPTFGGNGDHSTVLGWMLDLEAIEIPEFAEDEAKIRARVERTNSAITLANNLYDEAKKQSQKAAGEHAKATDKVDEAKVEASHTGQLFETKRNYLRKLDFELNQKLEVRKKELKDEFQKSSQALESYENGTEAGRQSIEDRYADEAMEKRAHWQNVIQDLDGEIEALAERLERGEKDHQKALEDRHQVFLQACSEEGVDASVVSRLHSEIREQEQKEQSIEKSRELVSEYQRWLDLEWSKLNDLNEKLNVAQGEFDRLSQVNQQKEDEFKEDNRKRINRKGDLSNSIDRLKDQIKDADTILDRFPEEPDGIEGRHGDLVALTGTLSELLSKLARLKKQVFEAFRSAQRVIQNYDGTNIHKAWEGIIEQRRAVMPDDYSLAPDDQAIRHVEALRMLLDQNIPHLEGAAREHFFNEAGKLVAYFEGLQNLTRKVRSVASVLDKHINTDQQIESLEDIRIVLTPKVQDDMSWSPLKNFANVWKDWSAINARSLPDEEVIESFKLVQNTLKDARLGNDIKTMVDIHIAMKEGGSDTIIRSQIDFEESSSKGLSYLAIMVIFMGMTRFLCPDQSVRIIWPVDELATLSNNNIPKLADMLERNNLTMMSACPDLNRALSRFFENKLGVLPGKIVQYTDDEALKLSDEKRSELKKKLALMEDVENVV